MTIRHLPFSHFHSLFRAALLLATAFSATADDRRFAFVYPAVTSPKGEIELENTVTWQHRLGEGSKFDLFEFRHSVEIGVTDHFQVELYPANWT